MGSPELNDSLLQYCANRRAAQVPKTDGWLAVTAISESRAA
jgi:hypothetical protein